MTSLAEPVNGTNVLVNGLFAVSSGSSATSHWSPQFPVGLELIEDRHDLAMQVRGIGLDNFDRMKWIIRKWSRTPFQQCSLDPVGVGQNPNWRAISRSCFGHVRMIDRMIKGSSSSCLQILAVAALSDT